MVKFDRYLGSNFDDEAFPIIPVEARWIDNGIECSRKQLPLNLAFAMTIHKAQRLILDNAVIDIGSREHSIGLSYVGLSRVRKITDLAIQQYFAKDRIDRIPQSQMLKDRLAYIPSVNLL
ncbi:ATP-dependent DNA helicase PIF1-like [Panonychus citri]|uniref:ATP-dependent DNA helicase PIF1-like n=1 Tax=Panonychus citri TaxID=50023 RepID=UPI00230777E7|nr:ATP-dependent DNA helicase PIF1-like [Panonychus citri]